VSVITTVPEAEQGLTPAQLDPDHQGGQVRQAEQAHGPLDAKPASDLLRQHQAEHHHKHQHHGPSA
jgi:hypothetical protein